MINYELIAEAIDKKHKDSADIYTELWKSKCELAFKAFTDYKKAIEYIWTGSDNWGDNDLTENYNFAENAAEIISDPMYNDLLNLSKKYENFTEKINWNKFKIELRKLTFEEVTKQKIKYLENLGFDKTDPRFKKMLKAQKDTLEIWEI